MPVEKPTTNVAPVIETGLSEEEDAARFLAKQFDKSLGFCINCEGYSWCREIDGEPFQTDCSVCGRWLHETGARPARFKR